MTKFAFLYETDSETDDGMRIIEAATREEARLEWVRQVVSVEGQKVHLDAIHSVKS